MDQAYESIVKSKRSALVYAATSLMLTQRAAACVVEIPETSPQQYVAAGTPEQIAGLLPEAGMKPARRKDDRHPVEPLVFEDEPAPAATSGDAPTDLQQIKALALAATPGPWHAPGMGEIHMESHDSVAEICFKHEWAEPGEKFGTEADAQFIAAANPAVVLDLIARIETEKVKRQTAQGMADCMDMVRQELIEAGVIDTSVPPMMIANAVLSHIRAAVSAATKPTAEPQVSKQWADATIARLGGIIENLQDELAATKPAPLDLRDEELDDARLIEIAEQLGIGSSVELRKFARAVVSATRPAQIDLPTNDEVFSEVQRKRGTLNYYVSTNAVNDTMAAVRSLLATKPAAAPKDEQQDLDHVMPPTRGTVSQLVAERAAFGEFWRAECLKSWEASQLPSEADKPMPDQWGEGLRRYTWNGWKARAALGTDDVLRLAGAARQGGDTNNNDASSKDESASQPSKGGSNA